MKRLILSAVLLSIAPATYAQSESFTAPRNALGQPDLQGLWNGNSYTPISRPSSLGLKGTYTEQEVAEIEREVLDTRARGDLKTDPTLGAPPSGAKDIGGYNAAWIDFGASPMRVNGEARTSLIRTPDGQPPLPKAGAKISDAGRREIERTRAIKTRRSAEVTEDGMLTINESHDQYTTDPEERSVSERCIVWGGRMGAPPMFATTIYNNNYQIVQSPDRVVILVEMMHDARIIRLNDKQHLPSSIRPWFGDSVGWYEGDTLVVETTNIPQTQALYGSWENLKVTERFKRVANGRMHYEFLVEDPTIWDKPWGGDYEFHKGEQIFEYACHEGNYGLPGILAGSRVEDAEYAAGKGPKPKPRQRL